jgi:hypothetical protein
MGRAPFIAFAFSLFVAGSAFADKFASQDAGLRCYTGDLLAELRTKVESGKLKSLPNNLKTVITDTNTLAVVIDYRKKDSEMIVGYVEKRNSRVIEFKTYTPKDAEYEALLSEFPALKDS